MSREIQYKVISNYLQKIDKHCTFSILLNSDFEKFEVLFDNISSLFNLRNCVALCIYGKNAEEFHDLSDEYFSINNLDIATSYHDEELIDEVMNFAKTFNSNYIVCIS